MTAGSRLTSGPTSTLSKFGDDLYRKHFLSEAGWCPLGDLMGLLAQINMMVSRLTLSSNSVADRIAADPVVKAITALLDALPVDKAVTFIRFAAAIRATSLGKEAVG